MLENTNRKITRFLKAQIDSTSEASVKNDDNNMESSTSLVEVEETITFIEADADEVFNGMTLQLSKDPGLWLKILSSMNIELLIRNDSTYYNNSNNVFPKEKTGQKFSEPYFNRILLNNEKIKRDWLVYSVSKNSVFCFCCRIFNLNTAKARLTDENGYMMAKFD